MNEVQAIERMRLVLNAPEHMRAADPACMPLDRCRRIYDFELVAIFQHRHIVARDDGDDSKGRTVRFPAFAAAAGVVVRDIAFDADLDRLVLAFADEGSAGEAARTLFHSVVNRWVDMNGHGSFLLVFDVFDLEHDDRTDRFSLVHQIESLVDLFQFKDVCDHRIDLNLSVHVPVDDFWHVHRRTPYPSRPGR